MKCLVNRESIFDLLLALTFSPQRDKGELLFDLLILLRYN